MKGKAFFDTTILIYAVSLADPRASVAERLVAALKIAAHYGYQIYDALIVAAALEDRCDTLYSEDMQNGQAIGVVTIHNAFTYPPSKTPELLHDRGVR